MKTLVVMPSVCAVPDGPCFFLDRKAVDGLIFYAQRWPGPVRCLMREGLRSQIGYGETFRPENLPFEVQIVPADATEMPQAFADAALILASGDSHIDFSVVDAASAPIVFIIEYTIATRLKINQLTHGLKIQGLKSAIWTLLTERKRRRAFRKALSLQCNGTPAFDAYRALKPNSLLYFDTRVSDADQISESALAAKQREILKGRPLRIAFSGRLEAMKGVDQLVPIARALAAAGMPFRLDIYGDGVLRQTMQTEITHAQLDHCVVLHGPVPFETVLIPAMIQHTDLFLCCHRQADPSCTYLETLSCGVPIVGYDNAAFRGVATLGDISVVVPMERPAAAAAAIRLLDDDREKLARMSQAAAKVGREHSFEKEFTARIDHLRAISGV